jgi:hypothetical protein
MEFAELKKHFESLNGDQLVIERNSGNLTPEAQRAADEVFCRSKGWSATTFRC